MATSTSECRNSPVFRSIGSPALAAWSAPFSPPSQLQSPDCPGA
ncbi:hypothetical protein [Lysobacter gummosus]